MLIHGQGTLMMRTVGNILHLAVLMWFLSLLLASRRIMRTPNNLWVFCILLTGSYCIGFSALVHDWRGLPVPFAVHVGSWVIGLAAMIWAPMLLSDLAPLGGLLRGIILANALCAPVILAVSLVLHIYTVSIALAIGSLGICALSLLRGISKTYAPYLRKRGLVLFGMMSSSGLLIMIVSLIWRFIYALPLLSSFGARVSIETAKALMLTGTVFAFLHIRSADRMLLRIVRLYLWVGTAFCVWLALHRISAVFPNTGLQTQRELRSLLSILSIVSVRIPPSRP